MREVYNVRIPRTAIEQYNLSRHIKKDELQEGDLVFFSHCFTKRISRWALSCHDKFVHVSSSNGVIISDMSDDYWQSRYSGAGRVKNNDESANISSTE